MMYPMAAASLLQRVPLGRDTAEKRLWKIGCTDVTAESWELAAHPDGLCIVENGPLAGKSILDLGELDRRGIWGTACKAPIFPLMVKLIDAKKDLSIQVHPSDETALWACGEQGKAEMWYIVDCEPQACLYFGFSKRVSKEEFLRRAKDGSICDVLNRVPVARGDVFYILPGTIHAIGGGIVIAEISKIPIRHFAFIDYQRKGARMGSFARCIWTVRQKC